MAISRTVKALAAGGAVAGAAVAAAAVAANPALRDEARRLRRLARPLGVSAPEPPVPPPLPPGCLVNLPGRGEVFVRDTGLSAPARPAGTGPPGPPVLLLHGWTASADLNFFAVYGELAARHRVLALDHRGHGRGLRARTPFSLEDCADDAAALLAELGVGPVIAVGFSMGGPVAMLLHHRHPDLVRGLVLCGTALEWNESGRERLVWRGVSLLEVALRSGTGEGLVARVLREVMDGSPELEALEPWVRGEFHRGYPTDLAGAGRALSSYDGRPLAEEVDVPCAVVVTTTDQLVRPEKQYELADALGAETIALHGDHFAPFNRGRAFAKAIRTAVDQVADAFAE
ncbi:MAG TPA: alpha/beta fold hydrolase [Acidimicrobiia bacterium]|nr:alpha/beta fold hydrolase [Acidimicrobiia bacterium]